MTTVPGGLITAQYGTNTKPSDPAYISPVIPNSAIETSSRTTLNITLLYSNGTTTTRLVFANQQILDRFYNDNVQFARAVDNGELVSVTNSLSGPGTTKKEEIIFFHQCPTTGATVATATSTTTAITTTTDTTTTTPTTTTTRTTTVTTTTPEGTTTKAVTTDELTSSTTTTATSQTTTTTTTPLGSPTTDVGPTIAIDPATLCRELQAAKNSSEFWNKVKGILIVANVTATQTFTFIDTIIANCPTNFTNPKNETTPPLIIPTNKDDGFPWWIIAAAVAGTATACCLANALYNYCKNRKKGSYDFDEENQNFPQSTRLESFANVVDDLNQHANNKIIEKHKKDIAALQEKLDLIEEMRQTKHSGLLAWIKYRVANNVNDEITNEDGIKCKITTKYFELCKSESLNVNKSTEDQKKFQNQLTKLENLHRVFIDFNLKPTTPIAELENILANKKEEKLILSGNNKGLRAYLTKRASPLVGESEFDKTFDLAQNKSADETDKQQMATWRSQYEEYIRANNFRYRTEEQIKQEQERANELESLNQQISELKESNKKTAEETAKERAALEAIIANLQAQVRSASNISESELVKQITAERDSLKAQLSALQTKLNQSKALNESNNKARADAVSKEAELGAKIKPLEAQLQKLLAREEERKKVARPEVLVEAEPAVLVEAFVVGQLDEAEEPEVLVHAQVVKQLAEVGPQVLVASKDNEVQTDVTIPPKDIKPEKQERRPSKAATKLTGDNSIVMTHTGIRTNRDNAYKLYLATEETYEKADQNAKNKTQAAQALNKQIKQIEQQQQQSERSTELLQKLRKRAKDAMAEATLANNEASNIKEQLERAKNELDEQQKNLDNVIADTRKIKEAAKRIEEEEKIKAAEKTAQTKENNGASIEAENPALLKPEGKLSDTTTESHQQKEVESFC